MQKKTILVLTSTFPRWNNDSTPRFVLDVCIGLHAQVNQIVLAPHHPNAKSREVLEKIQTYRFAYFIPKNLERLCYGGGILPNLKKSFLAKIQLPFFLLSQYFTAKSIIKKQKIQGIHAHWILPQGILGALLKRKYKIPLLLTIHGSDLFALQNRLFRRMQKFVIENSDAITINSEVTKKKLIEIFPSSSKKVHVVPMGIDIHTFRKKTTSVGKKYAGKNILLTVGRLSEQKGIQYLLRAMPLILKKSPDTALLIVGEGPFRKDLETETNNLKIKQHVIFAGAQDRERLIDYYNAADVFVMPSLSGKSGTEAQGLSLLEAMACSSPVVATNIGGIPEAIMHNETGILVPQKNENELAIAILSLLDNKSKRIALGKNAAVSVRKNFAWPIIHKKFRKIYSGVFG